MLMNNLVRRLLLLLPVFLATALTACGSADGSSDARIRILNVSEGYESIDLYSNDGDSSADEEQIVGVTRGTVSAYKQIDADTYLLKFRRTGQTGTLLSQSRTLAEDMRITFVSYGDTNQFAVLAIDEEAADDPDDGFALVQMVNTTSIGTFDLYLTDSETDLDDVSANITGVTAGSQSAPTTMEEGTYRLRVTNTGSKTDIRLNVPEITVTDQQVVSIILTETDNGVLLNAIVLPRRGEPTTYTSTDSAQARLLNVSVGYTPLDVDMNLGGTSTDVTTFTNVGRSTVSPYASVTAATYVAKYRRTGATGILSQKVTALTEDSNTTYVAYGITNRFNVFQIPEDEDEPDPGYTDVKILNTTSSNTLDIYLSGDTDSLDDVSPTVEDVAPGTYSNVTTLSSKTYRLRVTDSTKKTDLRLDVSGIVLGSEKVVSIIITDTPGGTLVGAVVLPQREAPVVFEPSSVRIRGALGLSAGSAGSMVVGPTTILDRRSARSFLDSAYTTVAAGDLPVTLSVDGVAVLSGTVTLQPGQDYTLLAYDVAGVRQLALLTDDNHVDVNGRAKVRLINGMSGGGAPLNLSANDVPVAEFVELAEASPYDDVDPGTEIRFDVINSTTLDTVLTRTTIVLEGNRVYTYFLAGGGANPAAATLRQDR